MTCTADGDVFGGFYSVAIDAAKKHNPDTRLFLFSFESHGRCMTPQRFVVKGDTRGSVRSMDDDPHGFVAFSTFKAPGILWFGDVESECWTHRLSQGFEGLTDTTLTGITGRGHDGPYYRCCCLVAFQMR